ncbi:alpha/beta hydrolase fold protein [Arthroderma uncinatum]|uniref:alpha/beta hydrolase fold protein n=1 Tax=Arthroderma uncinatum TaxID=74035 RepID=UPI00144AF623|nr:alpha/beta hydrolase fold protein [Arthroderma uncinatum]KAF3491179.1 alpha/beta hydrolase fold protein [Arthroderma uncinatum]
MTKNSGFLTRINEAGKHLYYKKHGNPTGPPIVLVHGLGGTSEYYDPLISSLKLAETYSIHQFDLEGHGRSPSSAESILSMSSFADDVKSIFSLAGISPSTPATLIGSSMGCIIATLFAVQNPGLVRKLILLGPAPCPLPPAGRSATHARATVVRSRGMSTIADTVATAATSSLTKTKKPAVYSTIRSMLLGQDPECYAKACTALADETKPLDLGSLTCRTCIITGDEDRVSPPAVCSQLAASIPNCQPPVVLKDVGHWHVFEDIDGVSKAIRPFLRD